MFKLCVFVALLSLVAAAPAPAPVPAPGPDPSIVGPAIVAGPWGHPWAHPVIAAPIVAAPRLVSVLPAPVSHVAISQVHPAPVVVKHLW